MTTYCGQQDLDSLLEGFTNKYYGTFLNDDPDSFAIGTQFYADLGFSFDETNEWLSAISSIKQIPIGTMPTSGLFPLHVRMLQANLTIYARLKSKHYGEFVNGIPSWISTYITRAREILSDIKNQNVVFETDIYQGESGIGVGSFTAKAGLANWYTNWETGVYQGSDFSRNYVIQIDGTTAGQQIGTATFKYSNDNGVTWATMGVPTNTNWTDVENGLWMRWEAVGTSTAQLSIGDSFSVRCVPINIPVKSGGLRQITFRRG